MSVPGTVKATGAALVLLLLVLLPWTISRGFRGKKVEPARDPSAAEPGLEAAELSEPRASSAARDRVGAGEAEPEEQARADYGLRLRLVTEFGGPCADLRGKAKIRGDVVGLRPVETDGEGYLHFRDGRPLDIVGRSGTLLSVRLVEPFSCWVAEVDLHWSWPHTGQDLGDVVTEAFPLLASGRVLLESGAPAAGALVAVYQRSDLDLWGLPEGAIVVGALTDQPPPLGQVIADDSGRFAIYATLDEDRQTQLVASHDGYAAATREIPPRIPSADLLFELRRGAGLRGLLKLDPLLPRSKVAVEVVDPESGVVLCLPTIRDEVDGLFPFEAEPSLDRRFVRLVVKVLSGFELLTLDPVGLVPGETKDLGVLDTTGAVHVWNVYPYTDEGPAYDLLVRTADSESVDVWTYGSGLEDAGVLVCSKLAPPIEITLAGRIAPRTLTLTAGQPQVRVEVELR